MLALGYSGWGSGQLEMELAENVWLVGIPDVALVYDPSLDTKWSRALAKIGVGWTTSRRRRSPTDFPRQSGPLITIPEDWWDCAADGLSCSTASGETPKM